MLRRPLRTGLGFLVFCFALSAWAEDELWVAVGSYRNVNEAETAREQAAGTLAEAFSITEVETESGRWYRVVAGPYLTREIAEHMLGEAQRAGFASAWVLQKTSGQTSLPALSTYAAANYEDVPLEREETLRDDIREDRINYRVPTSEPMDIPGFNAPVRPDEEKEHRVINEAPEEYDLHRLKRKQASLDWDSPFLLASTSAVVLAAALEANEAARAVAISDADIDAEPDAQAETDLQADIELQEAAGSSSVAPFLPPNGVEVQVYQDEPLVLQQWNHKQADITIDGRLDEEAWRNAMAINQLRVTEPDTLVTPRYDTEVRLFYTERGVYVSFDMEQPAETLVKRLSSRDNRDVKRDFVSFTLDTSGAARYAYWMTLALGDTQMDGTALPERQFSSNWDGAWWGATTETERGWSAEFFVPWSQMTMPAQGADGRRRIGFYSARIVAHLDERWAWPALPRSQPKFMSAFQPLEVLDVNPRQQWSLFPYAASTSDFAREENSFQVGTDVFWRPTTNLQLTATLLPDFGTVEADDVIVNLTAFENFFPERRLFFLEGREIFEATPRARSFDPITLFNTRRIGGSPRISIDDEDADIPPEEEGQPTELYGAAKVTGQVGGLRYGVLTAFEKDTTLFTETGDPIEAFGRDFAVGRLLYENNDGGAYRALGVMSTLTTHPDEDAATAGIDYHYLSRSGAWRLDGQFLYSDLDLAGSGGGGFFDLEYTPRQGMKYLFEYTHLDRKIDVNDAGFLRRNDITGGRIGTEWIKSGFTRFRDLTVETFLRYQENLDGYAIRSGVGGSGEFTLNNLHRVELELRYFPARYDDRNSFGNGTYRVNERPSIEIGYSTNDALAFSGWAYSGWRGDGVDGQILESGVGISWRPVDRLNFELGTTYLVREGWLLHQGGQNMTAFDSEEWQPELSMDFFMTARQELRLGLQWVGIKAFEDRFYRVPDTPGDLIEVEKPNDESDDFNVSALNFQVRYRWQIAPLSDVFLVYTRNGFDTTPDSSFQQLFRNAWNDPLGEQLVLKLRYRVGS